MGRMFEYNRFENDKDIKKDAVATSCKHKEFVQKSPCARTKPKTQKYKRFEEYEDCEEYDNYDNRVCPPYSELYPETDISQAQDDTLQPSDTTSTTAQRTKSARKSVEIAIKNQLSKFLMQNHDEEKQDDCEMINSEAPPKRAKVYDCMRDFLRKKFFQPTVSDAVAASEQSSAVVFDEVDYLAMMDSYGIEGDDDEGDDSDECLLVITSSRQEKTKYNRTVDVGCWPNSVGDDEVDSDAGIRDCCQLLSSTSSPKAEKASASKSPKHKLFEVPSELKEATWFQPTISSKAATEKLIKEAPGAFLIRQSSSVKPDNFILYLRIEAKVKKFVITGSPRCYKIKGAKKEFTSLKALVTHHSVMAEQLPVTLTVPRTTEQQSSHRYLDDFDTFESLQILGILKFLQSKNLEFS